MLRLLSTRRFAAIASAAVLVTAACPRPGAPPAPRSAGGDVTGTWLHRQPPIREAMELRIRADSVLGEGTYANAAGRSGTSTIVGKWDPSGAVRLDILRDTGERELWAGTLRGDTLAGTLTVAGQAPRPFDYVRQR